MLFRLGSITITFLLLAYTLIGCSSHISSITPEQKADMLYSEATNLHNSDLYDAASAQFEEYVRLYPESNRADNAKLKIGNGYFQQRKYDEALNTYQEILDVYPDGDAADQAMLAIGDIYFAKRDNDEAIEAYNKLLEKYPRLGAPIAYSARDRINSLEDMEDNLRILAEGPEEHRDNAQYDIGDIYFTVFKEYAQAKDEFQKVIDKWPNSEMADEALWRIGECYWNIASRELPSRQLSPELLAYINLIELYDLYPQLMKLDLFRLDAHWPAGKRGDTYELAYAQVRRIVNKYPGLKQKRISDFLPENYQNAFRSWQKVILEYPDTDSAVTAPERIAKSLIRLGNLYYNMGLKHFGYALYRESLMVQPTIEGHLGMARYYANITSVSGQPWAYRRAFSHIGKAEELTSPDSPIANDVSWAKEWMNYKMRIESLENIGPERR